MRSHPILTRIRHKIRARRVNVWWERGAIWSSGLGQSAEVVKVGGQGGDGKSVGSPDHSVSWPKNKPSNSGRISDECGCRLKPPRQVSSISVSVGEFTGQNSTPRPPAKSPGDRRRRQFLTSISRESPVTAAHTSGHNRIFRGETRPEISDERATATTDAVLSDDSIRGCMDELRF